MSFADCFPLTDAILILTFLLFMLSVTASALPEVEALKKKVAELEGQLSEWNTLFNEATQ